MIRISWTTWVIDPDTQTADAARYSYYERIKTLGLDSFVTAPSQFAGRPHEFTLGGKYQHLDKAFTYGSVDLDGDGYADELPIGIDGANDLPRLNLLGQAGALKRLSLSPVAQSIRPQGPPQPWFGSRPCHRGVRRGR
ncbi:hypothetical protein A9C11_20120 [Pseudomonas citronellolis]|uniref:Uncharacterized protein n=1 Tax=Pseudomonas citronellolis TaxID=53408 RepID=A0A1A9KEW6_9PSED|nr:hypothetical protein [Pseudomonas citronellolis]ANI16147.1 hypothetical protein A9C11_20120 [Pseudomonas citronellolis]